MKHPTPAYLPTRIMLAVAFIATVIVLTLALLHLIPEPFSDSRVSVFGLPSSIVVSFVALVLVIVGLVWMVRSFRGARDEPPAWRYRDR